ncbi:MAG: NUDIX domain-containing protein [Cyanobacteria bacterium J06598_1]
MGEETLTEVTLAILYREGRFLMQLRDDFPHIIYPGIWGFFGGHIEPGESADVGVRRELQEELGYVPPQLSLFYQQADETVRNQTVQHQTVQNQTVQHQTVKNQKVRRYFYHGELTVPIEKLTLNEGQDLALCSISEVRAGQKYSDKLAEHRALGGPHQQALLKFIDSGLMPSLEA